jgi:uncharacterized protein (TIGR03437 family)
LYVSPSQINFQVPYDTPPGSSKLVVAASGTDGSVSTNVTVTAAAPGIFVYGENWAVIQNQDYSVNGPSNPAKAGTYVTLYGTGVGLVSPVVQTGDAAPSSPLSYAATEVTASINGMPAAVVFAGLSAGNVGLLQVNVRIPALPSGTYRIQITAGGVASNAPSVAVVE